MAELLSHIVTEDGVEHRINDIEARTMIDQVKNQIGNIDLSNLDLELPTDPEFNSVTAGELKANNSMSIDSVHMSKNQLSLLLDFINSATSIEGVYF